MTNKTEAVAQESAPNGDDAIQGAAKEAAPGAQIVRSDGDLLVYYAGFNLSKFVRLLALYSWDIPSQSPAGCASLQDLIAVLQDYGGIETKPTVLHAKGLGEWPDKVLDDDSADRLASALLQKFDVRPK
jgi:hypothetical protein